MLTAATLATTSRSAGTAAAAAAATNSPRRRTLHTAPTPTHLWAPPTDQISPAARTDYPTPRFHAYRPALRRLELLSSRPRASLWHGLQRAGACSMVLRFRCAAARPACLPPCHRMAACPTAPSPSPLPYPESQIARRQRSDRGGHNCMRAVHAGVTDYRLNAPEIAIGRPLLVENRPCEVCAAWSPQW